IAWLSRSEALNDRKALLISLDGLLQVAQREIGLSKFIEHYRAAALQARIIGGCRCKLFERCFCRPENLAHRLCAHPLHIAQSLGDVEHQALGGLLRELEVTG